jgi:hypothetical protein
MTCGIGRGARFGFMILTAAIVSAGFSGNAVARTHKGHWQVHKAAVYESRAPVAPQQPAGLVPMRYYGGPKSPMWRGPIEN